MYNVLMQVKKLLVLLFYKLAAVVGLTLMAGMFAYANWYYQIGPIWAGWVVGYTVSIFVCVVEEDPAITVLKFPFKRYL